MFDAAVAASGADRIQRSDLPPPPKGRTLVVGAGKGAAAMARRIEQLWPWPLSGTVITRYGHLVPTERIKVIEAAHPIPDRPGMAAAAKILEDVKALTEDDLLICLISGGGSALLALPAAGLTLDDKRQVTAQLLGCGATISEINCLRKHLSAIKGGRLAEAAWPAKIVTLIISDVPGDDPSVIASGPTVPDPTTFADAKRIAKKYRLQLPEHVRAFLDRGTPETPKPGAPLFSATNALIIARPADALTAAADVARAAGYSIENLGDRLEGEARTLGQAHAALARGYAAAGKKICILSGGETTVTLRDKRGRGGRNTEYLLAFSLALSGEARIFALAADTDGIDGSENNAGAYTDPGQIDRARRLNMDASKFLAENNAYDYFAALGDLLVTGPTLTNVNDFRVALVN